MSADKHKYDAGNHSSDYSFYHKMFMRIPAFGFLRNQASLRRLWAEKIFEQRRPSLHTIHPTRPQLPSSLMSLLQEPGVPPYLAIEAGVSEHLHNESDAAPMPL